MIGRNIKICKITYFREFVGNIFAGQRILFILKKLLLDKVCRIILNKS